MVRARRITTYASRILRVVPYLGNQLAANTDKEGNTDEEVLDEIGRMFDAMDPALVAREASIPPHLKEMFIGYRGKEDAADISTSKFITAVA